MSEVRSDGARHTSTTLVTGGVGKPDEAEKDKDKEKEKKKRREKEEKERKEKEEKRKGGGRPERRERPCLACWEAGMKISEELVHSMGSCSKWRSMSLEEKNDKLKGRSGANCALQCLT